MEPFRPISLETELFFEHYNHQSDDALVQPIARNPTTDYFPFKTHQFVSHLRHNCIKSVQTTPEYRAQVDKLLQTICSDRIALGDQLWAAAKQYQLNNKGPVLHTGLIKIDDEPLHSSDPWKPIAPWKLPRLIKRTIQLTDAVGEVHHVTVYAILYFLDEARSCTDYRRPPNTDYLHRSCEFVSIAGIEPAAGKPVKQLIFERASRLCGQFYSHTELLVAAVKGETEIMHHVNSKQKHDKWNKWIDVETGGTLRQLAETAGFQNAAWQLSGLDKLYLQHEKLLPNDCYKRGMLHLAMCRDWLLLRKCKSECKTLGCLTDRSVNEAQECREQHIRWHNSYESTGSKQLLAYNSAYLYYADRIYYDVYPNGVAESYLALIDRGMINDVTTSSYHRGRLCMPTRYVAHILKYYKETYRTLVELTDNQYDVVFHPLNANSNPITLRFEKSSLPPVQLSGHGADIQTNMIRSFQPEFDALSNDRIRDLLRENAELKAQLAVYQEATSVAGSANYSVGNDIGMQLSTTDGTNVRSTATETVTLPEFEKGKMVHQLAEWMEIYAFGNRNAQKLILNAMDKSTGVTMFSERTYKDALKILKLKYPNMFIQKEDGVFVWYKEKPVY